MKSTEKRNITVEAKINAPVEKVWEFWTDPKHIRHWNNASDDWFTPRAENNLKPGGRFLARMEARDGSTGFDFTGMYDTVKPKRLIEYTLDDGRKVRVMFDHQGVETKVTEVFEAETTNPIKLQHDGWEAILKNFKVYAEKSGKFETLEFEITINAGAEKVYRTMIDEKKYSDWTSEFNPTSHFTGSWKKGSKMLFLGTGEDGKIGGMSSRIRENIPNRYISIEHLSMIQDGKEVKNPETDWSGALENYTLTEKNGRTHLKVETDTSKEYIRYFEDTWPKALRKLKEICER